MKGRKWDRHVSGVTEQSQGSSQNCASRSGAGGERRDITRKNRKASSGKGAGDPGERGRRLAKLRKQMEEEEVLNNSLSEQMDDLTP